MSETENKEVWVYVGISITGEIIKAKVSKNIWYK